MPERKVHIIQPDQKGNNLYAAVDRTGHKTSPV